MGRSRDEAVFASALGRMKHRADFTGCALRASEASTMVQPAIKQRILSDLDRLTPEQQEEAAELVRGLVAPLPAGASVEALMGLAGTLDPEAAREMMEAIEEGCERVDLDEW